MQNLKHFTPFKRCIGFTVGELTEMNWCQLSKEQKTTAERSKGDKTPQLFF